MTDRSAELTDIDGVPTLRFERRFPHPRERVWRAISDPAQMTAWFPAAVQAEPRPGAPMRFVFDDEAPADDGWDGEVLEVDPPRVFMFRWNRDVLRFELIADGDGCRLVFTHALGDGPAGRLGAARTAAGWDGCLTSLAAALDSGHAAPPPAGTGSVPAQWLSRAEAYVEKFGLGRGRVEPAGGPESAVALRFSRDLVWRPADAVWDVLTEGAALHIGERPPARATNPAVEPDPISELDAPRLLTYPVRRAGRPAGRVRWEIVADPQLGTRVDLTHTLPRDLDTHRAELLATWQVHLELFFAAVLGEIRCPWPQQRVAALIDTYR
ncbi:SRPBCC family protein [Nocardia veterana]|uniref:SRPBCC family protein n=2 Tax=Nocardia veterana TaxID=132249 RepID=A0A7X6RJU2_9NOCA|nr:SRPBCC family protein [Nocardia veterana]NKY87949.1 SRPBCC family protein [Nocardia veterana]